MTKEIFAVLAVLVSGLITVNSTVGWGQVLGQPVNLFAIFWLIILGLVNFAEDKSADAKHWSRWLKRRDGPMIYTRTVQALMRALDRLIMPGTAQDRPLPDRGLRARFGWYLTPRAADHADLGRLRKNPWSWPVYDKALLVAVLYPVFFAFAQWTATGQATGIGSVMLFGAEERD